MTVDAPVPAKKSDLGVRTVSAVVMLAVATFALWQGGWAFILLIAAVGAGVLWEFGGLVWRFAPSVMGRLAWMLFGVAYVGLAMLSLYDLRTHWVPPIYWTLLLFLIVWGTDVGAYFSGRAIGGPKIAPSISPSKTWAGLIGGIVASLIIVTLMSWWYFSRPLGFPQPQTPWQAILYNWPFIPLVGILIPVVAQIGDFFESGMKRAAGVKDSGHLIPGHGGLFDRVDGLIPAAIIFNIWVKMLTW